jgi:hypothetical protein
VDLTSLILNVSLTCEIVTDFFHNFTMAERKKNVLLTGNLKIALIKCSQELKNPYPDLTSTVYT